jgi:sugar/nucleoside kinase (ribokinase family)
MAMTPAPAGVTCIGGTVVDLLVRPVEALPRPGRVELVDEMLLAAGGCAVNSSSGLVRLGVPARFIGRVGRDGLGDFLLGALEGRGVEVDGARRDPTLGTSASVVFVFPDGERCMLHTLGAMAAFDADDIDWGVAARSRILFVAQFGLLGRFDRTAPGALLRARQLGMLTAMDTVWDPTGALAEKVAPCLPLLDCFIPSYDEAKVLTGLDDPPAMAAHFHAAGVRTVAIKLGERGCYVSETGGTAAWIPGYRVVPVDATGAGDAWCAGFLAALLEGGDIADAGRLGNAVGACCVTAMGAYDGIRSMAETRAFMAATPTGPEGR